MCGMDLIRDLGFSEADRIENIRRIVVKYSKLMTDGTQDNSHSFYFAIKSESKYG